MYDLKKYRDLQSLLRSDKEANAYYRNLPSYVQEVLIQRSSGVNSFESMRDYAENLTRGDG